ncbi:MAG: IS5 family transposase [Pseudomonadota bacterium]
MRGSDQRSGALFSYIDLEARVPAKHPLRVIKQIVDDCLASLDAEFEALYGMTGRSSVAPERLLRASLLQAFYSVRSERQLIEQIDYNLLFRWFVGLGVDDPVWDHSTFSKNRDRLLDADVAAKFLEAVLHHRQVKRFLSNDHFSVDGTLVEAWASMKSARAKDGSEEPPGPGRNGEADFHGKRRKNDTHASTTDPDAKLFRKGAGKEAKLCFMGHALMENRSGLVVQARLTQASGTAEREAAIAMIDRHSSGSMRRLTLGADKGYDAAGFVQTLRTMVVTPHIARHDAMTKTGRWRRSSVDRRTMRHPGYAASQRARKRIEEAFGWVKMIAGIGKTKLRGKERVGFQFTFAMAAYNLIRLPRLLAEVSRAGP